MTNPNHAKRQNNSHKCYTYQPLYLFVYKHQIIGLKMSGKVNYSSQHRDLISNSRSKLTNSHSKVILPRLANQESLQHKRVISIKAKDEDFISKGAKDLNANSSRMPNSKEEKIMTSRSLESEFTLKDEKFQVIREMKDWLSFVESSNKGQGILQDHNLPKLQKALKKWCFFIEEMHASYEKLENSSNASMKAILLKSTVASKQLPRKTPEPCEIQLKVQRESYEKQMTRLAAQIKMLEEQVENNRTYNSKSLEKISELQSLFGNCLGMIKKGDQIYKDSCQSIRCILIENQSFLTKLKESITTDKEATTFQERIDFQLANIKEYKDKYCQE